MAKIVNSLKRALDLLELFARERRPLSVREISTHLDAPVSSSVDIIHTLVSKAYLAPGKDRRTVFPTGKLYHLGQQLVFDGAFELIAAGLDDLNAETDETCMLTHYADGRLHVVAVRESSQRLRYIVGVGERIGLHVTAAGKCVLAGLDEADRRAALAELKFVQATAQSHLEPESLLADIERGRGRGWQESVGEAYDGLMSIAVPVKIHGLDYAVTIVGPIERIRPGRKAHAQRLLALRASVEPVAVG